MNGDGAYNPRTVEEVFRDYNGRRNGMIKALTTGKTLVSSTLTFPLFCLFFSPPFSQFFYLVFSQMFMSSTAFVIPVSVPFIDLISDDGKSLFFLKY